VAESDPASVGFEVDVYWAAYGGRDPLKMLEGVKGRVPYLHAKDMATDRTMTEVGRGTLDFPAFAGARKKLGIKCFLVEHDEPKLPSMKSAEISFAYLRRL
jgi:sugar phosphate isomerase/epimerase